MTDWRLIKFTPNRIPVDFTEMIQSALSAPIKDLYDTTAQNETTMFGDFYVEYKEVSIDLDTGVESPVTGPTVTDTVKVFFAGFDVEQDDVIGAQPNELPIILSNKPKRFTLRRNSADWIYIGGNSSKGAGVRLKMYDNQGNLIFAPLETPIPPGQVWGLPIGMLNFYWTIAPLSIASYFILEVGTWEGFINGGSLSNMTRYYVNLEDCDDDPEAEMYFREGKGGWTSLRFSAVEWGVNVQQTLFHRYTDYRLPLALRTSQGGVQVASGNSVETFTLTLDQNQEGKERAKMVAAMLGTRETYIRRRAGDGTFISVRCRVDPGSFRIATSEGRSQLQISCQLFKSTQDL